MASQAILRGGVTAGVLDLTAACVVGYLRRGTPPIRIMQSISSGLLGTEAYEGGLPTAALGVVLHFFIATVATAVFFAASRKLPFLVRQAFVWGSLYGIAVYFFMNQVVLPLSAFPHEVTYTPVSLAIGLTVHVLCVGLPISLTTRRYSR